ncbi:MAG TPA: cytochrome P460 family protein [Candidatus Acidoferrales bacterium]|nr:cytochrome P460 family protein [Candidatus Acidoferrales bacterium]
MKAALLCAATAVLLATLGAAAPRPADDHNAKPQYTGDKLVRPEGYREWIYLSSGLGMNYNPMPGMAENFTNVFVPQWAYKQFAASGKWPDKTIFVVEERNSETKGSINKTGHFQADLMGLGVEVKDENRFPDKWAYFNFGSDDKTAAANPKEACWECHDAHAAVEHSFVQFYPTLKPIAQKFGTYRQEREKVTP